MNRSGTFRPAPWAYGRDGQRSRPTGGTTKRVFDVVGAWILLVLLSPLFLTIAIVMRFADPGPLFFAHKRVGLGGRMFPCIKFRTMVMNSQEVLEQVLATDPERAAEWRNAQKLRNDPRVTMLGRVLRETSLDELPQLFNVVRGEMSLVGPRPIVTDEKARYGASIGAYESARPGITGLWQVSGRSDCTYEERVGYDTDYVGNWSLLRDVGILFRTVWVVMARRGSC